MSNLTVTLPCGTIQGWWDRHVPNMHEFLGLPYAAPPVRSQRFAPPAPYPRSDSWALAEPSLVTAQLGTAGSISAELAEATRLTLNVWSPAGAHNRPVLFWIHDDAAEGPGGWARHFGARFAAEHGIVVVAPDYRRGALGYLDLTAVLDGFGNGNFGLLDQMEALTWVATHIRAFGGDPWAITVAGQCDGAYAAALLAGLPRTGPLVRRLLLPEGAPAVPIQTPAAAARVAAKFLDVLGVDRTTDGALRDIDAATIARAEAGFRLPDGRSQFGLVAHDDIPSLDPTELLRTTASPVDVMVGSPGGRSAGYGSAVGAFVCTGDPILPGGPDMSRVGVR